MSSSLPTPPTAPATRGVFIAFEGGDSAGKSTQARLLADALAAAGHDVVRTREPGGTGIGEQIRRLVLDHGHGHVDARTEALLFAAARAAHATQAIRPALARGDVVITDRYSDSSVAYQGVGRGLGAEDVKLLNYWATESLRPDLTVLLDVDPAGGRTRRSTSDTAEDRLESEPDDFHARIRNAFVDLAAQDRPRYLVLDAGLPIAELATRIETRVRELLA